MPNCVNAKEIGCGNLSHASCYENVEIANLLLTHEACVNGNQTQPNDIPMIWAIENGHLSCVKLLLANRADVNYGKGFEHPMNPLCLSAYCGNVPILELLLKAWG